MNEQKNYNMEIAGLTEKIRQDPNDSEAYYWKNVTYYADVGVYDETVGGFTEAIPINPNYAEAYFERGIVYFCNSDYDYTIVNFEGALGLNPDYAPARDGLELVRAKTENRILSLSLKKREKRIKKVEIIARKDLFYKNAL